MNFKVVFNRSRCHGNYENVKFYLSIKIFHQFIIHLPGLSVEANAWRGVTADNFPAVLIFQKKTYKEQLLCYHLLLILKLCYNYHCVCASSLVHSEIWGKNNFLSFF